MLIDSKLPSALPLADLQASKLGMTSRSVDITLSPVHLPSVSWNHVDCHMGESETKNGIDFDANPWYYRSSLVYGALRKCGSGTNTVVLDVMIGCDKARIDTSRMDTRSRQC